TGKLPQRTRMRQGVPGDRAAADHALAIARSGRQQRGFSGADQRGNGVQQGRVHRRIRQPARTNMVLPPRTLAAMRGPRRIPAHIRAAALRAGCRNNRQPEFCPAAAGRASVDCSRQLGPGQAGARVEPGVWSVLRSGSRGIAGVSASGARRLRMGAARAPRAPGRAQRARAGPSAARRCARALAPPGGGPCAA
ncbi:hypothetical protein LPJ70_006812, partial [Coemansia sp. RSA 2708]